MAIIELCLTDLMTSEIVTGKRGAENTLQNACAGTGCTNTLETYIYNNGMQVIFVELGTTSDPTADYCLVYARNWAADDPTACAGGPPAQGGYNGGNAIGVLYQDNVNSSLSHAEAYSYDYLNRLTSAVATGNSTYSLTFSYDRYGNMSCAVNGSTNGLCPQYGFNPASNQITNSGFTYDASGDLTGDGTHTYQYDAEQRASSVDNGSAVSFTYNALGLRVESAWPSAASSFLYDPSGTWLGAASVSAVYLGSRLLAFPDRTGESFFPHVNPLGTMTMETYYNGALGTDISFYPWGNIWNYAGLVDYEFAGTIWMDPSASADYATYRLHRYDLGRWLTPDPLGGDITNPQSLNALNNPTTLTDPLGLDATSCGTYDGAPAFCTTSTDSGSEDYEYYTNLSYSEWSCLINNCLLYGGEPTQSGGGGGAPAPAPKPTLPSLLTTIKNDICSALPQGRTVGVGGGIGGVGGQTGTVELVTNYNTGVSSLFVSGGVQAGWNGGAQASAFAGFIYGNLGPNNGRYSGGFTTLGASVGPEFSVGAYVSASSGGLNGGPSGVVPSQGGIRVIGASVGASLLGPVTVTGSLTNYTNPLASSPFGALSNPLDLGLFLARQVCQ
jgi:RHS repeat-associated protein